MADSFEELLEQYSEYLTESTNRGALLTFGKKIFSPQGIDVEQTESSQLLKAKYDSLFKPTPKPTTPNFTIKHKPRKTNPYASLSQDQIFDRIQQTQAKVNELRSSKEGLEGISSNLSHEFSGLVDTSLTLKKGITKETSELNHQLEKVNRIKEPDFPESIASRSVRVESVIKELSELNGKIINRIKSFKQTIAESVSHVERVMLDKYKTILDSVISRIYDGADTIPIPEILQRFKSESQRAEERIAELLAEIEAEKKRNEKLQSDSHSLEERVAKQRVEVNELKAKQKLISSDIAQLDEFTHQEMMNLKAQYNRLCSSDSGTFEQMSSREVVVSDKKSRVMIKKSPSSSFPISSMIKNSIIANVDDFIEQERKNLLCFVRPLDDVK